MSLVIPDLEKEAMLKKLFGENETLKISKSELYGKGHEMETTLLFFHSKDIRYEGGKAHLTFELTTN